MRMSVAIVMVEVTRKQQALRAMAALCLHHQEILRRRTHSLRFMARPSVDVEVLLLLRAIGWGRVDDHGRG